MGTKLRPDLTIEAYRTADGGLFIAYGGKPPPEMCVLALEVAQEIWNQFGPKPTPDDPFIGEESDGTDDWFDDLPVGVQPDYDENKYDWDGETL